MLINIIIILLFILEIITFLYDCYAIRKGCLPSQSNITKLYNLIKWLFICLLLFSIFIKEINISHSLTITYLILYSAFNIGHMIVVQYFTKNT